MSTTCCSLGGVGVVKQALSAKARQVSAIAGREGERIPYLLSACPIIAAP
jgi:hypothetical protein